VTGQRTLAVGNIVSVRSGGDFRRPYGGRKHADAGTQLEITKLVGTTEAWAKYTSWQSGGYGTREKPTIVVRLDNLVWVADGTPKAAKPKARKLGEKPDGDEHIAIDDPRIAWIWEDISKFAQVQRYCHEYDRITQALGIPGRLRDITVQTKHNGVNLTATVKARSEAEAKLKIAEAFAQ
jgi:hypothetical protein